MLELPERRFRRTSVENIADYAREISYGPVSKSSATLRTFVKAIHIELTDEG